MILEEKGESYMKKISLVALAAVVVFVILGIIISTSSLRNAKKEPAESEAVASEAEETELSETETEVTETADTEDTETDDASGISFSTADLDGNTVTSDIFKDYDVTLVHVWATYCGPCIAEMGNYATLYENLPDNTNIIGLVIDVNEGDDYNVDSAKSILEDANASFTNLRLNEELYEVISNIQYVPSSFFVDSEGNIIGDILEGKGFDETNNKLSELTEQ